MSAPPRRSWITGACGVPRPLVVAAEGSEERTATLCSGESSPTTVGLEPPKANPGTADELGGFNCTGCTSRPSPHARSERSDDARDVSGLQRVERQHNPKIRR